MDAFEGRFRGLFVPQVTPFDESGSLDLESLERLASHLVTQGVSGLVSCARIGEGPLLSIEEKRIVYKVVGEVARKAKLVHVATIAPQSTDEAIRLIGDLETLPVDAAMVFPPLLFSWGKVAGEFKYRFFEDIARRANLPLVLFQVPVASYWYDVETVCRISEIERVVAYKEASFNVDLFADTMRHLELRGSKMQVLTGNDRFVARSYALGAKGALIGISNLATHRWAAINRSAERGNYQEAMSLEEKLSELQELVFGEPIVEAVSRIKAILQHEGIIETDVVRRPQLGVSSAEKKRLVESYRNRVDRGAELEATARSHA